MRHPDRVDAPFTGSVFLGMSVDGFIARLDGDLSWLTGGSEAGGAPDDGAGGDFGFGEFLAGVDALVMGRSTYEFIAPFDEWPYQGKPVHVLSTTLTPGADPRITVHASLPGAVAAMGAAGCRRVYVDGGGARCTPSSPPAWWETSRCRGYRCSSAPATPRSASCPRTSRWSTSAPARSRAGWCSPPMGCAGSAWHPRRSSAGTWPSTSYVQIG